MQRHQKAKQPQGSVEWNAEVALVRPKSAIKTECILFSEILRNALSFCINLTNIHLYDILYV